METRNMEEFKPGCFGVHQQSCENQCQYSKQCKFATIKRKLRRALGFFGATGFVLANVWMQFYCFYVAQLPFWMFVPMTLTFLWIGALGFILLFCLVNY
jgi:Na+-translocating ferredoxin:NAD+ oxidoreductase RnfA subunit